MRKNIVTFYVLTVMGVALLFSGCKKTQTTDEVASDTKTTDSQTLSKNEEGSDNMSIENQEEIKDEIQAETEEAVEIANVTYSRVSVHDPSVIKADGSYYIFGSHMAWAKSDDLMNWKMFRNNINSDHKEILGDIWNEYSKSDTNPDISGNLWAPDVIYNDALEKYCMYMSVNGDDWNSVIVLLTADDVEGPYEYQGPIVFSGFNASNHSVDKTDVFKVLGEGADLTRYQSINDTKINAIDPNVKYDEDGNLWMSFGSWFGGIYIMKLDAQTGLRDYSYTYTTEKNTSDEYYGYKIAGGNAVSGEGPYIIHTGDYYYLFLSYGGLTAEAGYQMRVFRSSSITGPYQDQEGNSAVYKRNLNNLMSKTGIRIMGSYKFSGSLETHAAQGHNSVFIDDDGKIFNVYHTRFAGGKNGIKEAHEVRVQQLVVNEDGWLINAPYEYSGENLSETGYTKDEVTGNYEFIIHTPNSYYHNYGKIVAGIAPINNISLNEDGTVAGDLSGNWVYKDGSAHMSITIDDVEYKGVFIKQATEKKHRIVMTFTAIGKNVCVWGSKK